MKWVNLKCLAATTLLAASASVSAALIDAPVPSNAFITFGGLDWAWASPCSPTGCVSEQPPQVLDLSYQATQGWRLPTASEFAARPQPEDFFFPGANVNYLAGISTEGTIFTGTTPLREDGACAVAYFTSAFFNQCDFDDAAIGGIFGNPEYAGEANVETWLVRDASSVPEPTTLALLGLGLAGLAAARRRKQ